MKSIKLTEEQYQCLIDEFCPIEIGLNSPTICTNVTPKLCRECWEKALKENEDV